MLKQSQLVNRKPEFRKDALLAELAKKRRLTTYSNIASASFLRRMRSGVMDA
jgi:hypothetical protein